MPVNVSHGGPPWSARRNRIRGIGRQAELGYVEYGVQDLFYPLLVTKIRCGNPLTAVHGTGVEKVQHRLLVRAHLLPRKRTLR